MKGGPGNKDCKVGGWEAHGVLITCSLLYLENYMDRFVFAAVMQPMKVALGLGDAQASFLQALFILIIVCVSGFVAAFVEWQGARTYPADMDKVRGATLQAERQAGIEGPRLRDNPSIPLRPLQFRSRSRAVGC